MAVMQNSIIFGGVDSADFGIYIGGEGTFDAPKRDVEMISIPGRNGAFALDKGRFQNIKVTYSAFNHEPDLATFSAQLEGFRNAICSQKGYQRLTDTFHPDEYRMAAYIDGLEIKPIEYNTAATFDIKFDCKPQRWLTSGEEAIDVTSGDTITNPTLFESSPMLEVEGYGDININDDTVTIQNEVIGTIPLTQKKTEQNTSSTITCSVKLPTGSYQAGDKIYDPDTHGGTYQSDGQIRGKTGYAADYPLSSIWESAGFYFEAGTPYHRVDTYSENEYSVYIKGTGTSAGKFVASRTITFDYDGIDTFTVTIAVTFTGTGASHVEVANQKLQVFALYVDSTKPAVEGTIYIDLDIGEAWVEDGGEVSPANNVVAIPAEMPKLKSGVNTITYDNTIDYTKITPRWWKI